MATGATLLARVRGLLNEPLEEFWKDTDIYYWLNEGVSFAISELPKDLLQRNGLMQAGSYSASFTGQVITISAANTAAILDITGATIGGKTAKVLDWNIFDTQLNTGWTNPYYTPTTNKPVVTIPPVKEEIHTRPATTASTTAKIYYNAKETVTSAGVVFLTEVVQDVIVNYAYYKALQKDERIEEAQALFANIKGELAKLRDRSVVFNDTGRK